MKLIHTADLHLKKGETKRIEILEWLVQKAQELEIDYFIIAGDLFDSDTDAVILRPELKKIFDAVSTKFLIIPGNHDLESFSHDYDYGKNVIQLIETPFEIIELNELRVCAVPYQNRKFSECVKNIPEKVDIFIAHGTLYDESFIFPLLDDKETEYMPLYPSNLENQARYVAMGHLHSRTIERKYKNTKVVYPGSPIALDTKCEGQRCVYFLNMSKKELAIKPITVDIAAYWLKKEFFVFPANEEDALDEIETYLTEIHSANIMPNIVINGFIGKKGKKFNTKIEEINRKFKTKFEDMKISTNIESWDRIMEHRLIRNFVEKTIEMDNTLRMKVFEISFPIFSEALK